MLKIVEYVLCELLRAVIILAISFPLAWDLGLMNKDAVRKSKEERLFEVARAFRIGKAIFTIWHSAIYNSVNMPVEGHGTISAAHVPGTPASVDWRSPKQEDLLRLAPRMASKQRIEKWLETAEISHEPMDLSHEFAVAIADMYRIVDCLELFYDHPPQQTVKETARKIAKRTGQPGNKLGQQS